MSTRESFQLLIQRVRLGHEDAAAELVREYEPAVRRFLSVRLLHSRHRYVIDAQDICQSVLASLFIRLGSGQFDVDQPEQLLRLLLRMARNKLCDQARRQDAAARDRRRLLADGDGALASVADQSESPSKQAMFRELREATLRRLSSDERYLAEQRALGRSWNDIATQLGTRPDAVRKQLTRCLGRVLREIGLDDALEETE